jgi:Tfp pilus assembly protein PilX
MLMRARDERGMAMVIALLVSFVLLILGSTIVAQSIHNAESSGLDRRRLQSVNAAEAGNNYFYAYLQSTLVTSLSCDPVPQTIASAPATASFTATPTFYDGADPPNAISCTGMPFTGTHPWDGSSGYPSSVSVQSTGTVSGQTPRTMQTFIRLTPVFGGFGQAILTNSGATFPNNFDVYGNNGNDGDVYILNGDLTISNTPHIRGNVFVPLGSATIGGSSNISGTLWTNGSVVLNNPGTISTNVISTTGSISGSGAIGGNATAGTTISGVSVAGTSYANTLSPAPPTQTFPRITYLGVNKAGYTINTFSGAGACTAARTFVESGLAGNQVVYITGSTPCTYTNSNNSTVPIGGNLMIISDWGINISNKSAWNATSANTSVFFISTWRADGDTNSAHDACGTVPTPWTSSTKSVATGNNTDFNSNVQAFFYSPCTVTMANQSNFYGQVMGDPVNILNQFTMTFRPVLVPGYGTVTSFTEDIAYVREVANP